jgi:hypothetical protein
MTAADDTAGGWPAGDDIYEISSATIRLRTTESGLPIAMFIAPQALSVPPEDLAHRILALCELSASRVQDARRRRVLAKGCPANVVEGLNLAIAENPSADEHDELPATWLDEV